MTTRGPATPPVVRTSSYSLAFSADGRWARLSDVSGGTWAKLSLLAALDATTARDETLSTEAPEIVLADGQDSLRALVTVGRRSSLWERARTVIECHEGFILVRAEVEGQSRLDTACVLGGRSTMPDCLGRLYSGCELPELFSPNPEDPRRITRSAGRPCVIGVTGDSLPGRGHWFFTPAPLYFALSAEHQTGGHEPADDQPAPHQTGATNPGRPTGWLAFGLVEKVERMDFTQLAYVPADGGFHLDLHYEGHLRVEGTFQAPAVLIVPGAPGPYQGIATYRDFLVRAGAVRGTGERQRPAWWSRPMFCGWGAQCHLASVQGTTAPEQCTQANYDRFLAELAEHGLVPPTVVIDDGWQREYGRATPDILRWPNLKAWTEQRHASGQHVLLWWKAWDTTGLPVQWCITNHAGAPVAVDPAHPGVQELVRKSMAEAMGPSGLDADGLKVDFTARTPSGYGLTAGGRWGIALLHEYLELIYRSAKEAKADALVITHTPNPGFADVTDMVRLNDILRLDEANPESPVVTQMRYRAAVARAACPELLVDTDDWCAPNLEQWREYLAVKAEIGVPALYYTTHLDRTGEALQERDYAALRDLWAAVPPAERNER